MMTTLLHMTCAAFAVVAPELASAPTSTQAMSGMLTASHVHPMQLIPRFVKESMSIHSLQWACAVIAEVVCMMIADSAQTLTQPRFGILTLSHATASLMLHSVATQKTSTLS